MVNQLENSTRINIGEITENLSATFKQQMATANDLCAVALDSYRSSTKVLDLNNLLRFATLNIFIKTERNTVGTNVFAPVSVEFMELVKNYESLTKQYGKLSTVFVTELIQYTKLLKKYRHLSLSMIGLAASDYAARNMINKFEVKSFMAAINAGNIENLNLSDKLLNKMESYILPFKSLIHLEKMSVLKIKSSFKNLKSIDHQLSNLSSLGEYAAHVANIEAARFDGREDLIAAFNDIRNILNQSLTELQLMRSNFIKGAQYINALFQEMQ